MYIVRSVLLTLVFVASQAWSEGPRLYVFDCGLIRNDDITAYGLKNTDTDVRELFVPCYLIEHGEQRLLWDGGLPLSFVGQSDVEVGEGVYVSYEVSLLDQLDAMGLAPDDIDYVAFSHFHFDHVGAGNAFVNSHLLIQKTEHEAAFEHAEENPIFDPSVYDQLADAETTLLNGDHDVFGDGSVVIISAPGHTPGHQVLYLELANTGRIVLSGDLYHFEKSRELGAVPDFNTNAEQTRQSFARVDHLLEETGATLWIEHSKALADSLNKAPAFYD